MSKPCKSTVTYRKRNTKNKQLLQHLHSPFVSLWRNRAGAVCRSRGWGHNSTDSDLSWNPQLVPLTSLPSNASLFRGFWRAKVNEVIYDWTLTYATYVQKNAHPFFFFTFFWKQLWSLIAAILKECNYGIEFQLPLGRGLWRQTKN